MPTSPGPRIGTSLSRNDATWTFAATSPAGGRRGRFAGRARGLDHATEMLPNPRPFLSVCARERPENCRAPREDNSAGLIGFSCGAMPWMGSGVSSRFRVFAVFETARFSRSRTSPRRGFLAGRGRSAQPAQRRLDGIPPHPARPRGAAVASTSPRLSSLP